MKRTLTDADVDVRPTSRRTAIAAVFGAAATLALGACKRTTPEPAQDSGDAEPPPVEDADPAASSVTDPTRAEPTQGATSRGPAPSGPIADSDSGPQADVAGS